MQHVGADAVRPVLFYAFALLIAASAWALVLSQNAVRMAVYLLLTLAGAAGLYFLLDAEFLAAIQLIVYAGGTLVLIIFAVMLTTRNPFLQLRVKPWETLVGTLVSVALAGLLVLALVRSPVPAGARAALEGGYGTVPVLGRRLLSTHLVPFEVAALLLLLVMVGAAYLARRRSRE